MCCLVRRTTVTVSLYLVSILCSAALCAVELDKTITIENKLRSTFENKTALNPANILKMGYPSTEQLSVSPNFKLHLNDMFSLTLTDYAFYSYSRF